MTKKLTATQIEGYKRNPIFNKIKIKNKQLKITMKFAAAALLAIAATAVQIKQEDGDLPYAAPECPPKPDFENMSDAEIFAKIDADGSETVDAQEGFNALYCMVEYGEMTREEAEWLWHYLGSHAGEDEELSLEEAQTAMAALEG